MKKTCPYVVGKFYLFRTVTNYIIGQVTAVFEIEIVVEKASWVASTGRFADALKTGVLDEVEPYPAGPVIIGRGSIVDAPRWNHPLPDTQK